MKILQINKFLYSKGGAETYLLALIDLLTKNGHQVIGFSQKNNKNIPISGSEFFVEEIKLDKFYFKNILKIGRVFWSLEAKKNIKKLIAKEQIDIVHLHNIYHQISPSILKPLRTAGLPIVMTVHDFKLINPNYTLWATKNRSSSKSVLAKILMAAEFLLHQSLRVYKKNVDLFIVPSEFVRHKLITAGFDVNKIIVLPHFVATTIPDNKLAEKNYIVCFGRLDESKGLDVLIRAFAQIDTTTTLKIIGSGPHYKNLTALAATLNIADKIEFIPHCQKKDLELLIAQSLFTVFPSLVHETFGLGIIESYLLGKPVIATSVGAYTENVMDKITGLLVTPDNITDLSQALKTLISDPQLRQTMGQSAKEKVATKFTTKQHIDKLTTIYKSLINKSSAEKTHYNLEKKYATQIINTPIGVARNLIIAKAYNDINKLVNTYRPGGIRGHSQSTYQMLTRLVSKTDKILDYGCGGGELVGLLHHDGYQASGFDVSSEVVAYASLKQNLPHQFITGDLTQVTEKYDLIVMDNVIEHIAPDEITDTLNNLKNILTEQGQLLIITPHRFSGPHDISGHFLKLGSPAQGLHLKEFDVHELVTDITKCHYSSMTSYLFNPRLLEKLHLHVLPHKLWLSKSLYLEKIFNYAFFQKFLKLNKILTKVIIAIMFPTIIIAKK